MENEKGEVKVLRSQFAIQVCKWCTEVHGRPCAWRSMSNEYCPKLGKLDDSIFEFEESEKKDAEEFKTGQSDELKEM